MRSEAAAALILLATFNAAAEQTALPDRLAAALKPALPFPETAPDGTDYGTTTASRPLVPPAELETRSSPSDARWSDLVSGEEEANAGQVDVSRLQHLVITGLLHGGYAVLLLYFILQAIEALHPGRFRPSLKDWPCDSPDFPMAVRYYEDVIQRTAAEQWAAWQHVRLSQLNAELAVQLHGLALKNDAKHRAVRRPPLRGR